MAVTVNHITKTIKAIQWELPLVENYLEHCVPISQRRLWKIEIVRSMLPEYRAKREA